ncbi:TIM21-domain-containing protein [Sporodiniella umbellata]|nr:TIM21-domain-containing protein [Sporodiniella umbellata]
MFRNLSKRTLNCVPKCHPPTRQFSAPVQYRKTQKSSLAPNKPWNDLTAPQKVVAASAFGLNVGIILAGLGLTSAIVYYLGKELFGSQSTTGIFSDAVDHVRAHETLMEMIGEPMQAHGEPSRNSRRRNRRVTSQVVNDSDNHPHLFMRFYLEGSLSQGTAMLEMVKDKNDKWEYKTFYVDVPGQGLPSRRVYLHR